METVFLVTCNVFNILKIKDMKKSVFLAVFMLFVIALVGQVPNSFNYQAVIRNSAGELVVDQSISIKISILEGSETGTPLYIETHSASSNAYGLINLNIGEGDPSGIAFADIVWDGTSKFIKVDADITGNTTYTHIGTSELVAVPYAINTQNATYADTSDVAMSLGSNKVYSTSSDTLFVVKDNLGQAVFAVFPDGAKVIVDQTAKGNIGGFAVSGRNPGKAGDVSIFSVTPDSTRVYVNNVAKGNIGGFAVSGRNPGKGIVEDILTVTSDSTRIYVDQTAKGNIGGFAVSGRNPGKATGSSFMSLTPDNYFIGHRAGEAMETGLYNTFIGYEAGLKSYWGQGNLFFGFNSGHENLVGQLNIFIGNESGYSFTGEDDGEENVFIGNKAGKNITTVANSIFIGTQSGLNCSNLTYSNTFVGDRTGANGNPKSLNTFIGASAGFHSSGEYNTYVGAYAGNAAYTGNNNVFVGYQAGASETGSGRLHIANRSDTSLIYGEFDNYLVRINADLQVRGTVEASYGSPSDLSLKTNLVKLTSGLNIIESLAAYYYDWTEEAKEKYSFKNTKQLGLIAQEVEKVLPELVYESKNGYKIVDYSKLTPVLVEAMKEQQVRIESLEKQNKELKEKVDLILEMLEKE